jgi:superfamily II DNA helicase RecQ
VSKEVTMANAPLSARRAFMLGAARVVVEASSCLQEHLGGPVPTRRLTNYLRGLQKPPLADGDAGAVHAAHGVFWAQSAAWVEELIERLVEAGYLEAEAPPSAKLSLTAAGQRLLESAEEPDGDLLPAPVAMGSNPVQETRLEELRAKLAREEGRPAFSIFSNSTLARLAAEAPSNLGELAAVPGFGEARLRRYGRRVLAALKAVAKS